jgi:hypothetical protein
MIADNNGFVKAQRNTGTIYDRPLRYALFHRAQRNILKL